jgi:hypothetical protein
VPGEFDLWERLLKDQWLVQAANTIPFLLWAFLIAPLVSAYGWRMYEELAAAKPAESYAPDPSGRKTLLAFIIVWGIVSLLLLGAIVALFSSLFLGGINQPTGGIPIPAPLIPPPPN